jgi:hypothetical protein
LGLRNSWISGVSREAPIAWSILSPQRRAPLIAVLSQLVEHRLRAVPKEENADA